MCRGLFIKTLRFFGPIYCLMSRCNRCEIIAYNFVYDFKVLFFFVLLLVRLSLPHVFVFFGICTMLC